jgi:hypothetical protein
MSDNANPWTTAEVEAIGRSWAYREKALATTRALETALTIAASRANDEAAAAKSLVERTKGLEGLWERAQIEVHEIKRELDDALRLAYVGEHRFPDLTWRSIAEDEHARAQKAERERDEARARVSELETALERIAFEPQGHAEATADQVLDAVTTIARASLEKAKGG